VSARQISKTSALKKVRSRARACGYRTHAYTVLMRKAQGMCVVFMRMNGGLSSKAHPDPRGLETVLGWGKSWAEAAAIAVRRVDDVNLCMPLKLARDVLA
jgi:hypothetical protein